MSAEMFTEAKKYRTPSYEVDSQFIERWSPRSFLEQEVPEDILFGLFEAARWAPSASNVQPWRFVLARSAEDREKFLSFIKEGNRTWCKKAPAFALIVSDKQSGSHAFDAGTAWGFLALQAAKSGLITHAMGGFDKEKAREVLGIPEEYQLHAVIAIGYQGEKEALPENLQEREKPSDRRALEDTVFEGSFNK